MPIEPKCCKAYPRHQSFVSHLFRFEAEGHNYFLEVPLMHFGSNINRPSHNKRHKDDDYYRPMAPEPDVAPHMEYIDMPYSTQIYDAIQYPLTFSFDTKDATSFHIFPWNTHQVLRHCPGRNFKCGESITHTNKQEITNQFDTIFPTHEYSFGELVLSSTGRMLSYHQRRYEEEWAVVVGEDKSNVYFISVCTARRDFQDSVSSDFVPFKMPKSRPLQRPNVVGSIIVLDYNQIVNMDSYYSIVNKNQNRYCIPATHFE